MSVTCHILTAGSCTHVERAVYRRGRLTPIELPSLFGVIDHPTEGLVLFDTGWSPWIGRLVPRIPHRAYRAIVPYEVDHCTSAAGQLRALGHDPTAVRHVIASHFHGDHIAGLPDFPNATIHAGRAGWEHLQRTSKLTLYRKGYFPELVRDPGQLSLVGDLSDDRWGPFPNTHDLFGDGALRLLDLGGHAPGQLGLLVAIEGGHVLFAADAAWMTKNITDQVGPSRIARRAIFEDGAQYDRTLARLNEAWRTNPLLRLVPSHCPEVPLGPVTFGSRSS